MHQFVYLHVWPSAYVISRAGVLYGHILDALGASFATCHKAVVCRSASSASA